MANPEKPNDTDDTLLTANPTQMVLPDYIAAEVFLENSGFFTPSSKRIKSILVKEKKIGEIENADGTTRELKARFSANVLLGLPITSDQDYYRAFQKICYELVDQQGRLYPPIKIPTKRLIRYAGKPYGAQSRQEVRDWFKRMTATLIEGGIYQKRHKDFEEGFIGTLFSEVFIKGQRMRDGKLADTNFIWPSAWWLSNYFYRNIRPIDFNFHYRLQKNISKSLYPLLETGWYAANAETLRQWQKAALNGTPADKMRWRSYNKEYTGLCEEFLITPYASLSRIQQQLDPAHEELQEEKFLKQWEYHRSSNGRAWVIRYHPGDKFFSDQKARLERLTFAEHRSIQTRLPFSDHQEYMVEAILDVCKDEENKGAYYKIVSENDEGLIWMVISETRQASLEGRITKTRGAYFTDTINRIKELRGKA